MAVGGPDDEPPQTATPPLEREQRAQPGDFVIIEGSGMAGLPRIGVIIAVLREDGGSTRYVVRWTGGDYDSRISLGPGARIERHAVPACRTGDQRP